MKRLIVFLILLSLMTACTAKEPTSPKEPVSSTEPTSSTEPASPPEKPQDAAETWTLLDEDYMPVYEDPCKEIEFPEFDGMTREEFYDRAYELGFDSETGPYITWAEGGYYSPTGRYLAYGSNKDCLNPVNYSGFSVFLLDTETGQERVLRSGNDGNGGYYNVFGWLDDETVLCLDSSREMVYEACGVDGSVNRLEGVSHICNWKGRYFVEDFASELRVGCIEADGSVTEIARTQLEGDMLKYCGISSDGKFACYIVQSDIGLEEPEYERKIVLWNTADGTQQTISPPDMVQGEDAAAISVSWEDGGFAVDFNIADVPDQNGHNELWKYQNPIF